MGRVNSAQSRMCGRGGVAGAATMTSQQVCGESTGKRFRQERVSGPQVLRHQVVERTRSSNIWRQKMRSFGPGSRPWRRREGEKVAWRKSGEWTWRRRRRSRAAKSWMSKKGSCRKSCEKLKILVFVERRSGKPQE